MRTRIATDLSQRIGALNRRFGYINRRLVLNGIREGLAGLPEEVRDRYFAILKEKKVIVENVPIEKLSEKDISLAVNIKKLTGVGMALNAEISRIHFQLPLPLEESGHGDLRHGVRAALISQEKPIFLTEIVEAVQAVYPEMEEKAIKEQLAKLMSDKRVIVTVDQEYAWAGKDGDGGSSFSKMLGKTLHKFHGKEEYISQTGLNDLTRRGEIVQIHEGAGYVPVWKEDLVELARQNKVVLVEGKKNEYVFYWEEALPEAIRKDEIALGIRDGKTYYILAGTNKESILHHRRAIFLFETEALIEELEGRGRLDKNDTEIFRKKLQVVYEAWEEAGLTQALMENLSTAQKVLKLKGSGCTVMASLFSPLTLAQAEKATKRSGVFEQREVDELKQIIGEFKQARQIPFKMPEKDEQDNYHIQNFTWMLMCKMENPESMRLFLAHRLKQAAFDPSSINAEETIFVNQQLAERFGFLGVSKEFKNILFRHQNPQITEDYRKKIEEAIGMKLEEAPKYLADFGAWLKQAVAKGTGIMEDKIEFRGRAKDEAATYDKIEERNKRSFEDIPDLLGEKLIFESGEEMGLAHIYLMEKFNIDPGKVDDSTANPKKSGWQAITLLIVNEDGKKVEVQLMTRQMDENDRFRRVMQAHWRYSVIREKTGKAQKFDEYPTDIMERLTGQFEHDYTLIRNYLIKNFTYISLLEGGELSSEKTKRFREMVLNRKIVLRIKRLSINASPVDLAAGAIVNDVPLLRQYGGAEIYSMGLDEQDQLVVRINKASHKLPLAVDHKLVTGEIVAIKKSARPFNGQPDLIRSAQLHAVKPAAQIGLKRLAYDPGLETYEENGRKDPVVKKLKPDQVGKVTSRYKFESEADFFAAVGMGLIDTDEIKEFMQPAAVAEKITEEGVRLTIRAKDIKGMLSAVLVGLPEWASTKEGIQPVSLTGVYSSNYFLFGEKRVLLQLSLSEEIGKNNLISLQTTLRKEIESSSRIYPSENYAYTIRVASSAEGWEIKSLVDKLKGAKLQINISQINLPRIEAGGKKEGFIEIEIPEETQSHLELLDLLLNEIREHPGVIAVAGV